MVPQPSARLFLLARSSDEYIPLFQHWGFPLGLSCCVPTISPAFWGRHSYLSQSAGLVNPGITSLNPQVVLPGLSSAGMVAPPPLPHNGLAVQAAKVSF